MGSECYRLNLNGLYCTYCTSPYPRTSISIHNRLSLPHPSAGLPTLPSLQTKRFILSHLIASGNLSISLAYTAGHFLPTTHLLLSLLLAYLLDKSKIFSLNYCWLTYSPFSTNKTSSSQYTTGLPLYKVFSSSYCSNIYNHQII